MHYVLYFLGQRLLEVQGFVKALPFLKTDAIKNIKLSFSISLGNNKIIIRTWRSWDAFERLSTSTSRHWSRKSSNNGESFSRPTISGFPLVAIK